MKYYQISSFLRDEMIRELELDELELSIQRKALIKENIYQQLHESAITKAASYLSKEKLSEFTLLQANKIQLAKAANFKESLLLLESEKIDFVKIFKEEIIKKKIELFRANNKIQSVDNIDKIMDKLIDTSEDVIDNKYIVSGETEDLIELGKSKIEKSIEKNDNENVKSKEAYKISPSYLYNNQIEIRKKEVLRIKSKIRFIKFTKFIINNFIIALTIGFLAYFISYLLFINEIIGTIPPTIDKITPHFIKALISSLFN